MFEKSFTSKRPRDTNRLREVHALTYDFAVFLGWRAARLASTMRSVLFNPKPYYTFFPQVLVRTRGTGACPVTADHIMAMDSWGNNNNSNNNNNNNNNKIYSNRIHRSRLKYKTQGRVRPLSSPRGTSNVYDKADCCCASTPRLRG